MLQAYIYKDFRPDTLAFIETMNSIVRSYQQQGYVLTVRQLYYQLVARDIIPNTLKEYKRVAVIINDAKLAGLMDWEAIEDRTREFIRRPRWDSPQHLVNSAASQYHEDPWHNQEHRVFVIIEKEALVGVLEHLCHKYDVPLLAARGYPSGSVLREFAVGDLQDTIQYGQRPIVLHLGDHDPSGIDMSRDLQERLSLFTEDDVEVMRIALTMDQIDEQQPPENPAKSTDSRYANYRVQFGDSSWELDALKPTYLNDLVEGHILVHLDEEKWDATMESIEDKKQNIFKLAQSL